MKRKEIEHLLWTYGLTPNYSGFVYLADALERAMNDQAICRQLLTDVAQQRGKSRGAVHSAIDLALQRMHLPPLLPHPPSRNELVYTRINQLYTLLTEGGTQPSK